MKTEDNKEVKHVAEVKPTPEQLLERVSAEDEYQRRGKLKIFLGYASGVGKSFKMIDEGRRRKERGQDVIVGAIQKKMSRDAANVIAGMEVIPPRQTDCGSVMDVDAILRRYPKVCLIDGLAYDNGPSCQHEHRWQDVESLLAAGISVITSLNLQHIEEKRDQVNTITGKTVEETVPLAFVEKADEIVVVDAPPDACMRVDNLSPPGAKRLTQQQLSELREIALLLAADVVDEQLERYLARFGLHQQWGTQERILVCLSPDDDATRMIESASRNSIRLHGDLIVAHVERPNWSDEQRRTIDRSLALARQHNAEIVTLDGDSIGETVLRYARTRGITQIYIGHKGRESWLDRVFGSELDRMIKAAEGIDVRVFPHT